MEITIKNTPGLRNSSKKLISLIAVVILLLITSGCSSQSESWESLPELSGDTVSAGLEPVWEDDAGEANITVQVFIEPYCHTNACNNFNDEVISYLSNDNDVHLEIFDYPMSQVGKSFMLSAVGRCIVEQDAGLYFDYLAQAANIGDAYDNNLNIQRIMNDLLGDYDRICVKKKTNQIKELFENNNPLGLEEVPAIVIAGRVLYGAKPVDEVKGLIESLGE